MIPYMVGKLAPNSSHLTRGVVKSVPGRGYFRTVPLKTGTNMLHPLPPQSLNLSIVREERERKKKRCVPEVTGAEHASKRYSNEVRRFGKRCCVGPGAVAAWRTTGRGSKKEKKYDLFLHSFLYDCIKNNICPVQCYFIAGLF